jgi:hypothetical protein
MMEFSIMWGFKIVPSVESKEQKEFKAELLARKILPVLVAEDLKLLSDASLL